MSTATLFSTCQVGDLALASRLVMAPLTRNRAAGQLPNALMATYYAQRANPATGAGLLISEATPISPMAHGYLDTPGLHSSAQVAAWRPVTQAVHAAGGLIVAQLWHVGRISHSSLLPGGAVPVSSTARQADTKTFVAGGFAPVSTPRALRDDELPAIVADYARAAQAAREAGFDGIEIHAANGYLLAQFLCDSVNDRSEASSAYGGPIAHRVRLLDEVVRACCAQIGAGRVGVRLSPISPVNDCGLDSDPQALYGAAVAALAAAGVAYVHVVEGQTGGARTVPGAEGFDWAALRAQFPGAWMVNNGYDHTMAVAAIATGRADLVAVGRPFIANPQLARLWRQGLPLHPLNPRTLYGGGAEGYTQGYAATP